MATGAVNPYLKKLQTARAKAGLSVTFTKGSGTQATNVESKLSQAALSSSSHFHPIKQFAHLEAVELKSHIKTRRAMRGGVSLGKVAQKQIVRDIYADAKQAYDSAKRRLAAIEKDTEGKLKVSKDEVYKLQQIVKNVPTKFKKKLIAEEVKALVGEKEKTKKLSGKAIIARRRFGNDQDEMGLHKAAASAADMARWRNQEMDQSKGGQLPRQTTVGSIGDLTQSHPKPPASMSQPVIPMATPD